MPKATRIEIKKEIYHWALEESQKEYEEIINKFPRIDDWINGDNNPTFKQLQGFADFLKIPLGYLFLKEPPKINIMEAEFRSINNQLPDMSKNLKDTITAMDMKRNWMSDYRKDLGWDKLTIIEKFNQQKNGTISHDASLAKELLGPEEDWYTAVKDHGMAYNFLKNKMEDKGILVMQNGVVGNNTRRKLEIHEFRAFMLYDDIAPIIFINNNDSLGGKIFSLVHEFIHVLLGHENLFIEDELYSTKENERYINRLTGEFLMPQARIKGFWDNQNEPLIQINDLASLLKVSETALAIKLKELKLIRQDTLDTVIDRAMRYFDTNINEGAGGGNFYNTFNTRISPTFTKAVITSTEAGDTDYTYAFRLLGGIKGKTFDEIRERVLTYG
ncbi:MAG: ImmA/IrrE family metallo-endopeptidase [Clostridiales bacterium]|nr:ImmA/IrrE family metallo-endopeptidase [Clostridiales bacterium]